MCFAVLTQAEVQYLQNAAIAYLWEAYAPCYCFYRNKSRSYFNKVFNAHGGVMTTLLKDASGDQRSPINGEISGLFFIANVDNRGQPFNGSPFGDTRLLVNARVMLHLASNMYFADFYCTNGKTHYVTLVLARPGSYADQLCRQRLPRLRLNDQQNNPFIFLSNRQLTVLRGKRLFVEVFFTEDLDVASLIEQNQARIQENVIVFDRGRSVQGGIPKCVNCGTCQVPARGEGTIISTRCSRLALF